MRDELSDWAGFENVRTFVDLFAGCGGLSLGLEQSGFVPVFVNEVSQDALATYLHNRSATHPLLTDRYHLRDIRDLVRNRRSLLADLAAGLKRDYKIDVSRGELDLVVGGPPCQGFSGIGHRRSYHVEREAVETNHLFQHMTEVIRFLKPKAFIFENVRGLLSAKWTAGGTRGEIWSDIQYAFATIPGYAVRYALIQAKSYGVPQNRPRILLVGIRDRLAPSFNANLIAGGFLPEPTNDYPHIPDLIGDLVDWNYEPGCLETKQYPHEAFTPIQVALRSGRGRSKSGLKKGAPLSEHQYSRHTPRVVQKFTHMIAHGAIPDELKTAKFAQRVLPEVWPASGPTITATSLPDDYVHYCQPRSLTVREWARIQTFPDWYRFLGKRTTGGLRRAGNPMLGIFEREVPKYTQIGNAVPVLLAKAVGHHLDRLLSEAGA